MRLDYQFSSLAARGLVFGSPCQIPDARPPETPG